MAKRGAEIQLTDRNYADDDEPEEAGHFKQANDEQINKRVIKKAKRRVTAGSDTPSAFKSFQGFGNPTSNNASSPVSTSTTFGNFKGFGPFGSSPVNATSSPVTAEVNEGSGKESQYMKQLKTLNQSVCDWIKKHITKDPYVDLSPVFKDYETHLANIDKKFTPNNNASTHRNTQMETDLGNSKGPSGLLTSTAQSQFTGFSRPMTSTVTSTSGLNGEPRLDENSTSTSSNSAETVTAAGADDTAKTDSQTRSLPEKDAFYSSRCKLFFKRGDSWAELGVGMLSLKKVNDKIQVTMRNDTTLGKILLNILVNDQTPVLRSGKNNVLLTSVPNPPVFSKESDGDNTKPVSYLFRVKTSENADELLKELKSNMTSS